MQQLSSIRTSLKVQVREANHHTLTTLLATARAGLKGLLKSRQPSHPVSDSRLRLGDEVRHGGHGVGQMVSHWPDGRVLVRFNRTGKSLLVWPSFLENSRGQRN